MQLYAYYIDEIFGGKCEDELEDSRRSRFLAAAGSRESFGNVAFNSEICSRIPISINLILSDVKMVIRGINRFGGLLNLASKYKAEYK
ncbi:MAG: hypothetical protein K2I48_03910, partial [Muribaculaceae bacterium]|nr:hypothetical protein [Muribaculaceae bacterium]